MQRWLQTSRIRARLRTFQHETFSTKSAAATPPRQSVNHIQTPTQARSRRQAKRIANQVRRNNFQSLRFHPAVVSALEANGFTTATQIQRVAARPILSGRNTLIAAETGSGKTLAYLAPLLSRLKAREGDAGKTKAECADDLQLQTDLHRPQIVVLLPTRELADQTLRVAKLLSHVVKFRARGIMGGAAARGLRKRLRDGVGMDVVVGTAAGLLRERTRGGVFLSRVWAVAVDEADVQLGAREGFREDVCAVVDAVKSREGTQVVYVAATVPNGMLSGLKKMHAERGGVTVVQGERLHRAADGDMVQTVFERVGDGEEGRLRRAVEVVTEAVGRGKEKGQVMVFCERPERRARVAEALAVAGIEAVQLGGRAGAGGEAWEEFRSGKVEVAVCAKSFARGVDLPKVGTVVLVECPLDGVEYLHRVGRVRGTGRVVVLVGQRDRAVAQEICERVRRGMSVAGVRPAQAWHRYTRGGEGGGTKTLRRGRVRWVDGGRGSRAEAAVSDRR